MDRWIEDESGPVIPGRYNVNGDGYIIGDFDEPRELWRAHVRMAPRINWVKLAWRSVALVLALLQGAASVVYAVWAGIAGYPRGRK